MVTCVAALAWLVASNHCAFATLAVSVSPKAAHVCCHDEAGPHSQPASPPSLQCCDTLKAALPAQAVAPAAPLHELPPAWIETVALPNFAAARCLEIAFATGPPPRAATFAESILNRCLLAHAPPAFVA
jgi:hypothetical protein